MTTNFNVDPNKKGVNGFGTQFSDTCFSATLVALADTTLAVPLTAAKGAPAATTYNKFLAVISVTTATIVSINTAAAVPVAGTFGATASTLVMPGDRFGKMVKSGDTLHFIARGTPDVYVEFFAIQE